jgi:hypothetical protein
VIMCKSIGDRFPFTGTSRGEGFGSVFTGTLAHGLVVWAMYPEPEN